MYVKITLIVGVVAVISHTGALSEEEKHRYCAFTSKQVVGKENGELVIDSVESQHLASQVDTDELLEDNTVQRCPDDSHLCFALWLMDPNNKTRVTMLMQGCWKKESGYSCERSECIADEALGPSVSNRTRYCCCSGDFCNVNVTDLWVPGSSSRHGSSTPELTPVVDPDYRRHTIIVALSAVLLVAIVIFATYMIGRKVLLSRRRDMDSEGGLEPFGDSGGTAVYDLENLKLSTVISSGRYGEVWRGTLNDSIQVAVKVFHASQRSLFMNEVGIYSLPLMEHPTVPQFFGREERLTLDGMPQYLLVTKYADLGCLQNYLKHNSLDWSKMCRMLNSIAAGLVHLHTELRKGDLHKPAVAHRDINSRNILVNPDLSCRICDYGFAMEIKRPDLIENGEQPTLSDVGTVRYMAPEVLDGAVNLFDSEASLKQIDVYALGLVLWEVAMRCTDLFQGLPVPEYALPFQAEVGLHPAFEEMQDVVVRGKKRPLFPDVWKSTNHAIRALKETIEDCWDQDGEARLTACCVQERLVEMAGLWEARQKGVTPTINPTTPMLPMEGRKSEPCNLPPPPAYSPPLLDHAATYPRCPGDHSAGGGGGTYPRYSVGDSSVSAGSTTDTTILSPSGDGVGVSSVGGNATTVIPPNRNITAMSMYYPSQLRRLQQAAALPQQGQNPTVERNTHKCSDEDMTVLGNNYVDKHAAATAAKDRNVNSSSNGAYINPASSQSIADALLDAIADMSSGQLTSLLQNEMQPGRSGAADAYHQNDVVAASEPLLVQPPPPRRKQQNLPTKTDNTAAASAQKTRPSLFSRLKRQKGDKYKDVNVGASATQSAAADSRLTLPFFNKAASKGQQSSSSSGENLDNIVEIRPGNSSFSQNRNRLSDAAQNVAANMSKSNLDSRQQQQLNAMSGGPAPVATEVCVVNGVPVVRAAAAESSGAMPQPQAATSSLDMIPASSVSSAQVSRQPHPPSDSGSEQSQYSEGSGGARNSPHSRTNRAASPMRPNSLHVSGGHNYGAGRLVEGRSDSSLSSNTSSNSGSGGQRNNATASAAATSSKNNLQRAVVANSMTQPTGRQDNGDGHQLSLQQFANNSQQLQLNRHAVDRC